MSLELHRMNLRDYGFTVLPKFINSFPLLLELRVLTRQAERVCNSYKPSGRKDDGAVHHIPAAVGVDNAQPFLNVLRELEHHYAGRIIEDFFEGPFILNSFGASINRKTTLSSYLRRIHRDIRTAPGQNNIMLNLLLMIDDFTAYNGPFHIFSKSHLSESYKDCPDISVTGNAGDLVIFNSGAWHYAGTPIAEYASERIGLTITLTKPWYKPQFDYPSLYPKLLREEESPNHYLEQLFGVHAQIPRTLTEWYQPPSRRMYKAEQG